MRIKTFHWTGRDANRIFAYGTLKATSQPLAKALLVRRGIEIHSLRSLTFLSRFYKNRILSPEQKVDFMRQFSTLIHAQVPIVQALTLINSKLSEHDGRKEWSATIRGDLENGLSLSEAFSKHPNIFDPLVCGLVRVGENSGTLDSILDTLVVHQENALALRQKIVKSLFYPVLTLVLSSVIGIVAFLIVVPRFEMLFVNVGADLPLMTRIVLNISKTVTHHAIALIGLLWVIFFLLKYRKRLLSKWALEIEESLLKFPVYGKGVTQSVLSRFCRLFALMLKAGVPITEGIGWMKGLLRSLPFEQALLALQGELKEGKSLQNGMQNEKHFPPWMVQMIAIGEDSGRLESMLHTIASVYEEQLTSLIEKCTQSLEPLVILIVGALVSILVVALYLPIFQLGQVIG